MRWLALAHIFTFTGDTEQGHSRRSSILAKKGPAPYVILRTLENGDYFGEYACLAGNSLLLSRPGGNVLNRMKECGGTDSNRVIDN